MVVYVAVTASSTGAWGRVQTNIMPFIELQSNLAASHFSEDFVKKLCSSTAAALGKPEEVCLHLQDVSLLVKWLLVLDMVT